jgi:Sulfatase
VKNGASADKFNRTLRGMSGDRSTSEPVKTTGSGIVSAIAASAITLMAALGGLGMLLDTTLLIARHAAPATVGATAGVVASLAVFSAVLAAPPLALAAWAMRRTRGGPWELAWPAAAFAAGIAAALLLTDAFFRPHTTPYVIVAAAFGAALGSLTAVMRLAAPRVVDLLLLLAGGCALAVEVEIKLDRELQDLVALVAAFALVGGLRRLHRRLRAARPALLALGMLAALGGAAFVVRHVDAWAPGWRPQSWQYAHWEPRLARALRALIDFDNDGYSPIAWGGDCDDFDATRNPAGRDHDGIDANCNGTVAPLHPGDADRGLLPPAGEADVAPGSVDLVVLVTVDCLRYDSLTPELTPRLQRLAQSGISLSHLYAAAADTIKSLPLMLRGSDGAPTIGERLRRGHIDSTALFATHNPRIGPVVLAGFDHAHTPTDDEDRWTAAQLTDRALAGLPARGLVWLHYYDPHLPYRPRAQWLTATPGRPAEMGGYLAGVADVDREIGRLEDALRSSGRWARTLLVVTGDHGESFEEHGVPYHGLFTYEAVSHVPGLLAGGPIQPRRIDAVLSHRDLPATLLGAFGLVASQPDVEQYGRSWLRLRTADALHRFAVMRSTSGPGGSHPMAALVDDQFKLIVTFENDLTELYRPRQDPEEKIDLRAPLDADARRLLQQLALFRDIDGYP